MKWAFFSWEIRSLGLRRRIQPTECNLSVLSVFYPEHTDKSEIQGMEKQTSSLDMLFNPGFLKKQGS